MELMSGDDVIWFCRCATMAEGELCPKHDQVSEADRLRRKADTEAYDRLCALAKRLGSWVEVERLANRAAGEKEQKPRQIINVSGGDRMTWMHFDLDDGGRVSIPADQVQRMWNEEQKRRFEEKSKDGVPPRPALDVDRS